MTDPDQTLQSIDDTLEDYEQWDGHSPDAARWAGGPEGVSSENWPPSWDRLFAAAGLLARTRGAMSRVYANSRTAEAIREAAQAMGERVDVVEMPHVPDGTAYVFQPSFQRCCDAGTRAAPGPCPWHGAQT